MPEKLPSEDDLRHDLQRYFEITTPSDLPRRVAEMNAHTLTRAPRPRRLHVALAVFGALSALVITGATVHLLDSRNTATPSAATALLQITPGQAQSGGGSAGSAADGVAAGPLASGNGGSGGTSGLTSGSGAQPKAAPATVPGVPLTVGSPPSATIERSVSAAYTVPPGAFLSSFQGVISRAVSLGGYVVSSTTSPDATGRIVSGGVTLKVPTAKIADFLNGMPSTFAASAIDFGSVDHTAAFVDVNARLGSARTHLAALDGLLAKTYNLGDITSLEQQIEAVQTEIDTDQGQLNVLQASVDFSTATVQMSERGATVSPPSKPGPVPGGLATGWSNAVAVTGAVLEGVVSALPIVVLAVILGLVAWLGSRWARRRRDAAFGL
jgi:hypothetical protein